MNRLYALSACAVIFAIASCSQTETPQSQQLPTQGAAPVPSIGHSQDPGSQSPHHNSQTMQSAANNLHSGNGHAEHHRPIVQHQHADGVHAPQLKPGDANAVAASSLEIFEKRILPIFQSTRPSSCAECHLSGVDLKEYIRPTQQATFESLVNAGMIDLQKPDNSKLLQFINRRPEKPGLVTEEVRRAEFEAFRTWIRAAARDPKLLATKGNAEPIGPQLPEEIIRHARKDRVLSSFIDNIWNEVGRCAACHSPDRNQKQVKEHGEQVSWIKLRDPQATLDHMLAAGLIDPSNPEQSLLLLKPTMQVKHGGGQKMVVGDRTYKQFRRFIDDYAAIVHAKYQNAGELPKPGDEVSLATDIWLKVENVPAEYDKQLMQVDIYQQTDSGWTTHRLATSDRAVFGKNRLWQHSLSLTAPRGSAWAETLRNERLPLGRYLVKMYVDQSGKLSKDYTAELSEQDFVGQAEVQSGWPAGYGQMTTVPFPSK